MPLDIEYVHGDLMYIKVPISGEVYKDPQKIAIPKSLYHNININY